MSTEPATDQGSDSGSPRKGANRPPWAVGGVLILVGIIFVIQNLTGFSLNNWWALFILIPAIGSLATAYQMWEKNDRRLTAASWGPLVGGLVLLGVTAVFLFNWDWGKAWPFFLILAGVGVLLGAFRGRKG
jgi:hypothetical protein